MEELGRNPARIIAAWRDYIGDQARGQRVRGIGEPIWPGRRSAVLVESQHHEALLDLAFADTDAATALPLRRGRLGAGRGRRGPSHPPYVVATGRGLWLANQACDLVQLRSSATGTVVRLEMVAGAAGFRRRPRRCSPAAPRGRGRR